MPSIGNGYIGTIIMNDDIHVSGVYNGRANVEPIKNDRSTDYRRDIYENYEQAQRSINNMHQHTHRARIPSTVAINFTLGINGVRSYALDLQQGCFYQWFDSDDVGIEQRIYAHRTIRNIMVNEIQVRSKIDFMLNLKSNRGEDSVDINFHRYRETSNKSPWQRFYMAYGTINETEYENLTKTEVAVVWTPIPTFVHVKKGSQNLKYITAISTSLEGNKPRQSAIRIWKKANAHENLFELHAHKWEDFWQSATISVQNNLYLAQVIYSSFYYILSSIRSDWNYGLSPGGLAGGEVYFGHVFWDQDIWMYPAILMFFPDLAKSIHQYRFNRLISAKSIAKKYKFRGKLLFNHF